MSDTTEWGVRYVDNPDEVDEGYTEQQARDAALTVPGSEVLTKTNGGPWTSILVTRRERYPFE